MTIATEQLVTRIPPRSGTAFLLRAGRSVTVIDPMGEQVADLIAFAQADVREYLSSGRSIDYANTIYLTAGHVLYSNRSRPMLTITHDTVGRHDFLLTPCSVDTFRLLYQHHPRRAEHDGHPGCFGNLAKALAPHGISPDAIPTTLNIFMNVTADPRTGALTIAAPLSTAGDRVTFHAETDLIVGLTACSAGMSNNGAFKPIDYVIEG